MNLSTFFLLGLVLSQVARLGAAETNLAAALQKTVEASRQARRPGIWQEARTGRAAVAPEDPAASEIGRRLKRILPAPPQAQDPAQAVPRPLLRQNAGPEEQVQIRPENRTVMQLRGRLLQRQSLPNLPEAEQAEASARAFLQQSREWLGLDDPARELVLEAQQVDSTGERHLRFAQMHLGVPVWPAGLAVHLNKDGDPTLIDGAYIPTPRLNIQPVLTSAEAVQRAQAAIPSATQAIATEPALIIYAPLDRAPRLAWRLDLTLGWLAAWRVVVDAETGAILSRVSRVCDVNATGSAKDLGGVTRSLNLWSESGKFYLADTSRAMFNTASKPVTDPKGVISIFDARSTTIANLKTVYLLESASASDWLADGVSAMYNFGLTYEYFLERFGRNSLDGSGGNIQAVVRVAEMDNAFWNGNLKMMFFGSVRPYPEALDVVGHELAHGLTQHAADLVYELQPGALNESFSDIFGEMVELRAAGGTTWKLGERLGKVFRDFKTPGSLQIDGLNRGYPAKMSEFIALPNNEDNDHGGVHLNSSIINHCFYQLAEGLPGAIGARDAEKIFYRALTTHLQKQSQFIDARLGCIAAAETLFGATSVQAQKTAEAFDFVEIFATPPTPEPSPIPVVAGADSTLLITTDPFFGDLLLGRREAALGDPADGVLVSNSIRLSRPSVSGDGSLAVFVSANGDLCSFDTDSPQTGNCLGLTGLIHSVALSPDGKLAAFVLNDPATGQVDNRISVFEFATERTRTFNLVAPVLDGSPVDNVLYADTLTFSSDDKQLIYDAASEIRFGGSAPVVRWSIFSINLATESTSVLVPPLAEADFGNPNLGRAGNRYLTFDARNTAGTDFILTMDLFTGEFGQVGTVGDGIGFPCFSGDENAIIYAQRDPFSFATGYSLVRQPLAATRLAAAGQGTLWLADAQVGVIYRRGAFVGANQPPTAAIAAPAAGASFTTGTTISISVNAADGDGTVAAVEFYDGSQKLGEDLTPPYSFAWTNPTVGAHRLIARATDNLGAATDSTVVLVSVGNSVSTAPKLGVQVSSGRVQLLLQGEAGSYAIEQSPNLSNWSERFNVSIDASGRAAAEEAAATDRRFYRAVRK